MTPDERNMLADLANKIAQTPAPPRDPEAEEFIRGHIGNRPDALYLMTQTVLIQNMALQQAQQQIKELQQKASQPAPASGNTSSSFLGGSQPQSNPPRPQANYGQPVGYGQQGYAPPPPQYSAPAAAMPNQGGAPSFLMGAAKTAAGVAAGALAFEGIRSLFSHPGYGGFGGVGSGFMGGTPAEETVVNNYYDNPQSAERGGQQVADTSDVDDSTQYNDVQDTTEDNNAQLQDVDDSTPTDDGGYSDDNFA